MPVILLSAPTADLSPATSPGNSATLIWDDVDDYTPDELKTLDQPKRFIGPTDPDTIVGVVLNKYDTWVPTS